MNPDSLTVNFNIDTAAFTLAEDAVQRLAEAFAGFGVWQEKQRKEVESRQFGGRRQIRLRD
jgi:hypothetical protein